MLKIFHGNETWITRYHTAIALMLIFFSLICDYLWADEQSGYPFEISKVPGQHCCQAWNSGSCRNSRGSCDLFHYVMRIHWKWSPIVMFLYFLYFNYRRRSLGSQWVLTYWASFFSLSLALRFSSFLRTLEERNNLSSHISSWHYVSFRKTEFERFCLN